MIQEEKELLLKDLCARLPYGVFVQDRNGKHILTPCNTEFTDLFGGKCNIKPYLRPMSSMTDEEFKEYSKLWDLQSEFATDADIRFKIDLFDWLDKNMFDYRGLIPMGLALEAPKDMYQ